MIKKQTIHAILLTFAVMAMVCSSSVPIYANEITDTNTKEKSTVYPVEVNELNFPDVNFRDFIQMKFGNEIDESEVQATKELNLSEKSIASLQGIEHFTALENLRCDKNQLTELDISNNTALVYLHCTDNQLTTLDVSNNQALTDLYCASNYFRWLNLENMLNLSSGSVNWQSSIKVPVVQRGEQYVVDMKAVLSDTPQLNRIAQVSFGNLPTGAVYNDLTGELVYNTIPPSDQTYHYDTKSPSILEKMAITMNFEFAEEKHTVTFDSNGGSEVAPITDITSGSTITKPADPTKDGYTFVGWYQDESYTDIYDFSQPIAENITLYAKWMKEDAHVEYTVKYDSDGGTVIANKTVGFDDNGLLPANAPTKEGYTFKGWKLKDTARTDTFITPETTYASLVTDNTVTEIILVAVWEINKYTVDFKFVSDKNPDGISAPNDVTVEYGKTTDEPKIKAPENWTFDGWYMDKECKQKYDFNTPIRENMTLYGKWTYKAPDTPKTGDTTNLALFITLFGISSSLLLLLVSKRKKQRDI